VTEVAANAEGYSM